MIGYPCQITQATVTRRIKKGKTNGRMHFKETILQVQTRHDEFLKISSTKISEVLPKVHIAKLKLKW